MMNNLPHHILTEVLEVINAANESMDCLPVRQKALDALFNTIPAKGAIFFLPDGTGRLTSILLKNLEKGYCDYYRTYFHQFDPLQLTRSWNKRKGSIKVENTISYDSFRPTEYYNDFLKPQEIHHKLIINLVAEEELYGRIVLTRSRGSDRFNKNEINTAKTISPYIAHALAHNDLRRKMRLKGNVLNYFENESSMGVILLDEGLQVVYRNPRAEEIFSKLKWSSSQINAHKGLIASQLLNDCREIQAGLKTCPRGGVMVPRRRVVNGPDHTKFSIVSRVLNQGPSLEGSRLLMVSIEEESPANLDPQSLMDKFHLSKREVDVVTHLFSGLKNAQIASELFVSEVTIKKHLQNIFTKVGVSNRTALVNKILTA